MDSERVSDFIKARYYSSIVVLYAAMLLFAFYALKPAGSNGLQVFASGNLPVTAEKQEPSKPIVSGKPVKIVLADLGIDLPVEEGRYNDSDSTWTLSADKAHFAMVTPLANDSVGNTFIYGHNNKQVFGALKKINPGALAQIYADNNKVFQYIYESTYAVAPDNTTVLNYQGPSILTVQTCSGAWNEQRQMYTFRFERVDTL